MQVNKFVAIGAIALVSIGAIAFVNNVKYQEDKRYAQIQLPYQISGCELFGITNKIAIRDEVDLLEKPDDTKLREIAKDSRERAEKHRDDCRKVQEYKDKYGN